MYVQTYYIGLITGRYNRMQIKFKNFEMKQNYMMPPKSSKLCIRCYEKYEGDLKSFRPSLRETRDKRPLDKESKRSWCHRHTTSMIKLFWSQPMGPWASASAYGQGEKFSA